MRLMNVSDHTNQLQKNCTSYGIKTERIVTLKSLSCTSFKVHPKKEISFHNSKYDTNYAKS